MITSAHRDYQWRLNNASHRHVKSRRSYVLLHRGLWEKNLMPVCIYQAVNDGVVWVRPAAEFDDGRFTQITPGDKR